MLNSLVGYTGFVGSNIAESFTFDNLYNSKNITDAFYTEPDLLIYAGIPAEKFLANRNPEEDLNVIMNAINNIKKINPKKLVLISTIDVYKNTINVDEDSLIDTKDLQPYGLNRYYLEEWVEKNINDHLIVRLPGLYGNNIKKNFIFDLISIIPSLLNEEKFNRISSEFNIISNYYLKQDNGFYKCRELKVNEKIKLKQFFNQLGFSALDFTDSRGYFQFYNLKYLWEHIQIALMNDVKKLNLAVEPISISELYQYINGNEFVNEIAKVIPNYNFKTKYAELFNGKDGYIFNKAFIMEDIKRFVKRKEVNE